MPFSPVNPMKALAASEDFSEPPQKEPEESTKQVVV